MDERDPSTHEEAEAWEVAKRAAEEQAQALRELAEQLDSADE